MSTSNGPINSWDASIARLDPARVNAAIQKEGTRALKRIGLQFEARARKAISGKKYAPNSAVTIALKGASTPLVGGGKGGDLFASITSQVSGAGADLVLWVGVNRNKRTKEGKALAPIAKYLHDGCSINLAKYPKVRRAVFAQLSKEAKAGNAKAKAILEKYKRQRRALARMKRTGRGNKLATGASTKMIWVIPPRPFITDILKDPNFEILVGMELRAAIERALGADAVRVLGRTSTLGRIENDAAANIGGLE